MQGDWVGLNLTDFQNSRSCVHQKHADPRQNTSNGIQGRLPPRSGGGVSALIFDCDGVLADTERDGHLAAFNQTFSEFGLPLRWTEAEYAAKLTIGGGKERLASVLTPSFVRQAKLPADPQAQRTMVSRW